MACMIFMFLPCIIYHVLYYIPCPINYTLQSRYDLCGLVGPYTKPTGSSTEATLPRLEDPLGMLPTLGYLDNQGYLEINQKPEILGTWTLWPCINGPTNQDKGGEASCVKL